MKEMVRAQHVGGTRCRDRVGEQRRLAADLVGAFLAPDAQRIQHRRDAADGELAVIGHHRRYRVPMHLGTRHVVRFDMVGVKLDQARDDEIAGHVLGARRRQAAAELATSTIWSATASRMSLSWMIATTATPRRFFSAMRSITTAQFSLSSEAVGSSSSNTGRSGRNPLAMFTRCCSPPEKVAGGTAISRSGMLSRRSRTAALARASSGAA